MQSRIDGDPADATVVTVSPMSDLVGPKLRRFNEGRRYIGDGAAATDDALPRLAAALPWLSGGGASRAS